MGSSLPSAWRWTSGSTGPGSLPYGVKAPFSRWHDFGSGYDDRGLVTAFRANVPEPGTLALLAGGLLGFALASRRKDAAA